MQGRDMIGRARTGTGKTLAFGIPIMDKIIQFNAKNGFVPFIHSIFLFADYSQVYAFRCWTLLSFTEIFRCGKNPLALVLAPTRELAKQVEKEFKESAGNLYTLCVYGGSPIGQQMRALNYGVDVVVGTPGRVIDLLGRGALNLREVQFVVLDEADQMLNVGFKEDVEKIMESLPENRQTMLFSATMPTWIRNITRTYLKNPVTIDLVSTHPRCPCYYRYYRWKLCVICHIQALLIMCVCSLFVYPMHSSTLSFWLRADLETYGYFYQLGTPNQMGVFVLKNKLFHYFSFARICFEFGRRLIDQRHWWVLSI